jgi:hypothetical protein
MQRIQTELENQHKLETERKKKEAKEAERMEGIDRDLKQISGNKIKEKIEKIDANKTNCIIL